MKEIFLFSKALKMFFTLGNYLSLLFGNHKQANIDWKANIKARKEYNIANHQYQIDQETVLDWMGVKDEDRSSVKGIFRDEFLELYARQNPMNRISKRKPRFADFYQPSSQQQMAEGVAWFASWILLAYCVDKIKVEWRRE